MSDPEKVAEAPAAASKTHPYDDVSDTTTAQDILAMEHTDPVLDAKMRLVNNVRLVFLDSSWTDETRRRLTR